jgi:mono/diheme cytochrome c family protein
MRIPRHFGMQFSSAFAGLAALLSSADLAAQAPASTARLYDIYCDRCHEISGTQSTPLDFGHMADDPESWSRAERYLRAGTMPPVGSKRPDRRGNDALIAAVERALDRPAPRVDDSQAIATRLAALLWDAAPDEQLHRAATRGQLGDSARLEAQVHRMLADPRAKAFVTRFFVPWLGLDKLDSADPDLRFFPGYEPSLRDSLLHETELFLLSQLADDRDPVELWTANYTFLNEQLARHYGVTGVSGTQFRRVVLASPERAGLLGQGSIQMATSRHKHGVDAAYTSPAARARWVLTHFLGSPAPTAFPGAPPVSPDLPITGQTRTMPTVPCVDCHRNFFPLGYALENFDPIGRWRTADQAGSVDTSGALVDGTTFNGPVQMRNALLQWKEAFRTTLVERMVAFAEGASVKVELGTPATLARARQILRDPGQARWSTLIAAVVRAQPQAPRGKNPAWVALEAD